MTLDPARFPPLTLRWFFFAYQALSARIGVIFVARAWGDPDAMPAVVYGHATNQIGPLAWALFFTLVHCGAALAILMRSWGSALVCCWCSVVVYVVLGVQASGAPGGLVVEEFSIGLHAVVQLLIGYEMWLRWRSGDDG